MILKHVHSCNCFNIFVEALKQLYKGKMQKAFPVYTELEHLGYVKPESYSSFKYNKQKKGKVVVCFLWSVDLMG